MDTCGIWSPYYGHYNAKQKMRLLFGQLKSKISIKIPSRFGVHAFKLVISVSSFYNRWSDGNFTCVCVNNRLCSL